MDGVNATRDVVFGDAGDRPLRLDLYEPAGEARRGAAAVLVHGGGWVQGSKAMLEPHARELAARGFTVFVPEYRLTPEAPWPAQIHDVKRAIRYARGRAAELGFDPEKLVLQGHSAGAHLVLLAAGTADDDRLDPPEGDGGVGAHAAAVVAVYPPVLLYRGEDRPSGGTSARALQGAGVSDEVAALASPITHVSADFPPVMLLHGDADKVVPVSATHRFAEALRGAGGRADVHVFAGLPHGFANHPEMRPMLMAMIAGFFRRTVDEPEAFALPAAPRAPVTWR
ncbi:MAG TPA: alpha/beta hydrolase [Caulobacteraceae bacterium]|nr:alpha/beta hydrolase [Caulobacteraceae bacterium]